ncbi:hypothetical protein [Aromatoleum anaerobium]|uniref:Uncharacterized protein n=1 Tax=Aromatoleum anaerobium TaxID=182180 RepID=A0ABX1PRY9_9RHOO|nr:hypothetical protein [Aromatoleum anaerobium]MCK0508552.1 hypothetical protein [Aromatoleum anaerobium]MCK0509158.1 hypothetical protein [Aromatoleum anaerobium]
MRAPLNPVRPPVARIWLCKFEQKQKEVRLHMPVTKDVVLSRFRLATDAIPMGGKRA